MAKLAQKLLNPNPNIIMALSNLRKAIFYLQQALREPEHEDDKELLEALKLMSNKEIRP